MTEDKPVSMFYPILFRYDQLAERFLETFLEDGGLIGIFPQEVFLKPVECLGYQFPFPIYWESRLLQKITYCDIGLP